MPNMYKPEGTLISTPENKEWTSCLSGLEKAMNTGKILESTALLCDKDMRLHLDLGGIPAVMEKDEVAYTLGDNEIKDIAVITRVGKPICFKVQRIQSEPDGTPAVFVSRREAQKECVERYISTLRCGDVVPARITHMENFGAFADVGCGVVSLLSIDCISVSRISHPRQRLSVGQPIWAVVKSIDIEEGRIFLTQKELLGTWEENAGNFEVGQTVAGVIRSIEDYGVFVELAPNLAGLAEIRGDMGISLGDDCIGKCTAVYIKSIIPEKMKIKLVLVDSAHGEPIKTPLKYYIDGNTCRHLDHWCYSPDISPRKIQTYFE